MKRYQKFMFLLALALSLILSGAILFPQSTSSPAIASPASCGSIFISEYVEGSSYNKAIELFNGTGTDIDLSAEGYKIEIYFNGSSSPGQTINLSGVIADGGTFVVVHPSANATLLALANQTGNLNFNGDDAVVLKRGTDVIDVIGQVGYDPGSEWGSGDTSTENNTLRRIASVSTGDTNPSDSFDPSEEWIGYPQDTFDGLGSHSAACAIQTNCSEIFFSEYIEGSSNNKALEIYNGTGLDIDLAAGDYKIFLSFNGGSLTNTITLTGTITSTQGMGGVFVFAHASADPAILQQADMTTTQNLFNGDDTILLLKGNQVIDSIGQLGFDPGSEWGSGDTSTQNNTLRRLPSVHQGDTDPNDAFDPSVEWTGYPVDTFDGLGWHNSTCFVIDDPPYVANASPSSGAEDVDWDSNIIISFSEPVTTTGAWVTVEGETGSYSTTISGGPTTYTIDPDLDLAYGELITVTVYGAMVTDQDYTPDTMLTDEVITFTTLGANMGMCGDPATLISAVQGNGDTSPMVGSSNIVVEGIVVGDYQDGGQLSGFFVQEETTDEDSDPLTSEGVFVYYSGDAYDLSTETYVPLNAGDKVRVQGDVTEYYGLTEINHVDLVLTCPINNSIVSTPAVTLPLSTTADLEPYEGMQVVFNQQLFVTEHYNLGRYGQFWASAGDRLWQPTHVTTPGANALAQADANDLNRILIDDASNIQNPDPIAFPPPMLTYTNTLRGGDTLTGMVGVIGYGYGNYMVYPTSYTIAEDNPRPDTPPDVGGSFKVASFNVLNYFNGDGQGGGFPTSRGADSYEEFVRQRDKIINAILSLNADVIGLMEIENDGYDQYSAIQDLVNGLNAAAPSGTTYDFIDPGVPAIGTDEIAVGIIYRVETAEPVGAAHIVDSNYNPAYHDEKNRPTLIQTFKQINTDEVFTVVVHHLKSKGSPCDDIGDPDAGDGQGNCNLTRTNAVTVTLSYLGSYTGTTDTDFLVIGDLNSYRNEDPIVAYENGGFSDLLELFQEDSAYSYVFDGEWGYLDYALGNTSILSNTVGAALWHINADEPRVLDYNEEYKSIDQISYLYGDGPFRASDHDPVIVGLFDYDFSDLGANYGVAYHTGGGALRLGTLWDANGDISPGADDATDDGVQLDSTYFLPGGSVPLEVTTNGAGYLAAWFDWDGNNTFSSGEMVLNETISAAGTYTFTVDVPLDYEPTQVPQVNARFRLYAVQSATFSPIDRAEGGEVEDYTYTYAENSAPTFTSTPVTVAVQDTLYTYNVTADDPDLLVGDTLSITAETLPAWLTLTDNGDGTAVLSGTPAKEDVGDHTVLLKVTDSGGLFDTQTFTITVYERTYYLYLPLTFNQYP